MKRVVPQIPKHTYALALKVNFPLIYCNIHLCIVWTAVKVS